MSESVVVLNPVTAVDGYGNPISVTRDSEIDANRLLVDGKVQVLNITQDAFSEGIVQIDTSHRKVHLGLHYTVSDWADITAAGTEFDILIETGASFPHMLWSALPQANFEVEFFEDTTATTGSTLTAHNNSRNSSNTALTVISTSPSVSVDGTSIFRAALTTGHKEGAVDTREEEYILKPNSKYLLRYTKVDSGTNRLSYKFTWYEGS